MTEEPARRASDPQRWPVRLVGSFGALLAALLLVALVVLVQRSNQERDAALARTRHSYDIVLLTMAVERSLAQAEAALGRFVIDADRRTGTLYYDEWRRAGRLIGDLGNAVKDDPRQAARVRALLGLYDRRGGELALPAARANYRQGWAALSLFAQAGKSNALPRMSATLREIAQAEGALLNERSTVAAVQVSRSNGLAQLLSLVGVLLAVTVGGLAWLLATAFAARRLASDTAEIEADRAAALERAVVDRTAELSEANRQLVEEAHTREQAEARLRQVQKMDAVGQLTGGIAHDFNNMLAVVLGGLEMAKKRVVEQAEEANRHLDSALEGATRAAALTRRLLSFARAQPLLPGPVRPFALLAGMSDLIDRTIGERVEVRIDAPADTWSVWIDAYQLENAILNLAVNARDAMDGAGRLEMSTANVRLGPDEVGALPPGDYVRISVADDGPGIEPRLLERVFEPFFTTKPVGQGTGLGLSQILGFARQSGGDVAIVSTPGQGTTVSIYLPRHQGAAPAEPRPAMPADQARAEIEGTILVVEDDPRVRAAIGSALDELGYRSLLCESGEEAMERLAERDDIVVLMTDVVMPNMTGPELAETVRARYPAVRLLFVTGFVGEGGEAESFKDAVVLRKPFTLRGLADALAAVSGADRAP